MTTRTRLVILGCLSLAGVVAAFFVPRLAQSLAYHNFSDQRAFLGVPNFNDVVSNAPFLVVGIWGLALVLGGKTPGGLPELRAAYAVFFAAVALVAFGSGYYHLYRTNDTLLWDRLPLAVAFMAFFAAIVGERIGARFGRALVWPLVALGVASVVWWRWSGDLRAYYLVQGAAIVLTPTVLVLFRSRLTGTWYLWAVLACYVAAKTAEMLDAPVFAFTGFVSGHTLKHLLAAGGTAFFLAAVARRRIWNERESRSCG